MATRPNPRRIPEYDELYKADGITYDNRNRINYHPEFHPNHGKPFTVPELIYLCKFYEIDGPKSMSFALGRRESVVSNKATELRTTGRYDYYKNLSEEEWEQILEKDAGNP